MRNRDVGFIVALVLLAGVIGWLAPHAREARRLRGLIREMRVGEVTITAIDAERGVPIEGFKLELPARVEGLLLPTRATVVAVSPREQKCYWAAIDPVTFGVTAAGYERAEVTIEPWPGQEVEALLAPSPPGG